MQMFICSEAFGIFIKKLQKFSVLIFTGSATSTRCLVVWLQHKKHPFYVVIKMCVTILYDQEKFLIVCILRRCLKIFIFGTINFAEIMQLTKNFNILCLRYNSLSSIQMWVGWLFVCGTFSGVRWKKIDTFGVFHFIQTFLQSFRLALFRSR